MNRYQLRIDTHDLQVKNEVLDVRVSEYINPVHKFGLNPNAPVGEESKLNASNNVSFYMVMFKI